MHKLIAAVAIFGSITAFANVREDIARTFTGTYRLDKELANDTKEPCAPELRVKYWNSDKLLDLQFLTPDAGIFYVNQRPSFRTYLENTFAFDVINKVNVSIDEKYKTTTRITNTRIEERTYKGKPGKYKIKNSAFFSRNPFNQSVRFEFINKKSKRKECLYK